MSYPNYTPGRSDPAVRHFAITPSDSADLSERTRAIYCQTAGTVRLRDCQDNDITYTVFAGLILPFVAKRVLATGTTATVIGWR